MATVYATQPDFLLSASDVYNIGDSGPSDASTLLIHIVTESAGTIAVTVKARARGCPAATPFLAVPYLSLNAAGTVVAGATYSTAVVAGNSIILLPASGLEYALDNTYTNGTHRAYVRRLAGAAA